MVPLLGAIAGGGECTGWRSGCATRCHVVRCHCWVPLLGGVNAHIGGLDVPSDSVPLPGAMVRCSCCAIAGGGSAHSQAGAGARSCQAGGGYHPSYATLKYAINCQLFYSRHSE